MKKNSQIRETEEPQQRSKCNVQWTENKTIMHWIFGARNNRYNNNIGDVRFYFVCMTLYQSVVRLRAFFRLFFYFGCLHIERRDSSYANSCDGKTKSKANELHRVSILKAFGMAWCKHAHACWRARANVQLCLSIVEQNVLLRLVPLLLSIQKQKTKKNATTSQLQHTHTHS